VLAAAEILDYLRGVARDFGVDRLVRTGWAVQTCAWDDAARRWTLTARDGRTLTADAVVLATGPAAPAAIPRCPAGRRSPGARCTPRVGRRDRAARQAVAMVGTGASAVQVVPEIAPRSTG
jgi:cation diffusion facilitator CzcD-associated flavoprotein CzcO